MTLLLPQSERISGIKRLVLSPESFGWITNPLKPRPWAEVVSLPFYIYNWSFQERLPCSRGFSMGLPHHLCIDFWADVSFRHPTGRHSSPEQHSRSLDLCPIFTLIWCLVLTWSQCLQNSLPFPTLPPTQLTDPVMREPLHRPSADQRPSLSCQKTHRHCHTTNAISQTWIQIPAPQDLSTHLSSLSFYSHICTKKTVFSTLLIWAVEMKTCI